jgi:hypothetical protein
MSQQNTGSERFDELLSHLVDGNPTPEHLAELESHLQADPQTRERLVNTLLLDSLLREEASSEAVLSYVDLVSETQMLPADSAAPSELTAPPRSIITKAVRSVSRTKRFSGRWTKLFLSFSAATGLAVILFLIGREQNAVQASPAQILRAAAATHAELEEHVYTVEIDRTMPGIEAGLQRSVQVRTLGDRFYVEMNHGARQMRWGRFEDGSIWICLGTRRGFVIEQDELGAPLEQLANLYSMNLESLLQSVLRHCQLSSQPASGNVHVITATNRLRWRGGWLRSARIEVDRQSNLVRRLRIERELPQQGVSEMSFTLTASGAPDESKYQPEGHLEKPYRLLTRENQPDVRRQLLRTWFSPIAERWIKPAEPVSER